MVTGRAIKATNKLITNSNTINADTHIYVTRKSDAAQIVVTWDKNKQEMHWNKYQITETDFRTKTATFTSPHYLDLTTGSYAVLITSTTHEDFAGPILSVEYDTSTGLYNYQCQDFSRAYQGKIEVILHGKTTIHRLLKYLITQGGIPISGKVSSKQLSDFKTVLSGLLPSYQYDLKWKRPHWNKKYGGINFTERKPQMIIRDASWIEVIRDICLSGNTEVDVYFNNRGIVQIEPMMMEEWANTGLHLTPSELASEKLKFDTTNIITGVVIKGEGVDNGFSLDSSELIGLNLATFFGDLYSTVDNPVKSISGSQSKKKSTNATSKSNPYGTKKKVVELSMDNVWRSNTDAKFYNKVVKGLKKNGWKVKENGHGPNRHAEKNFNVKNGVHFTLFGGVDCGVIKEMTGNNSYTKRQKRLNSRTVCGYISPPTGLDIHKGGKNEKWIPQAHDDNYGGCPKSGMKNPYKRMVDKKIPFMYAKTADEMVAKFLKGGDEPKCL